MSIANEMKNQIIGNTSPVLNGPEGSHYYWNHPGTEW
jgi:hypothetical protein